MPVDYHYHYGAFIDLLHNLFSGIHGCSRLQMLSYEVVSFAPLFEIPDSGTVFLGRLKKKKLC